MGWRSAGAAFRAGTYDGPLTSDEGGFASGLAETLGPGLQKAADTYLGIKREQREEERAKERSEREFERQKELIMFRDTLAKQRLGSGRSKNAEKDAAKLLNEANAISSEFGVDVESVLPILIGNDGDGSQTRNAIREQIGSNTFFGKSSGASSPEPFSAPAPFGDYDMGTPVDDTDAALGGEDGASMQDGLVLPEPRRTSAADDLEATEQSYQVASRGDTVTDVPQPLIQEKEDDNTVEVADVSGSFGLRGNAPELTFSGVIGKATPQPANSSTKNAQFEAIQRAEIAKMTTDRIQSLLMSSPEGPYKSLLESSYRGRISDELVKLDDENLAALTRTGDPVTADVAKGILEAKEDFRRSDPSRVLAGLDTIGKTMEKRLIIANDPYYEGAPDQRERLLQIIDKHAEDLRAEETRKSLERNSEPQLYGVLDDNGMISYTTRMTRTENGFVDDRGQAVQGDNFVWINPDDVEGYMRLNNKPKQEIVDQMISVANTTRDLADLAGIIENNPNVTNRFNLAAQDVVSFLGQAQSFVADLGFGDKTLTLQDAIRRLDAVEGLGADRKKVAILALQSAYGIAAMNGSSGQALSDKELEANLRNIYSTGRPEDVLAGIYLNIRRVTEAGETARATKAGSLVGIGRAADTFSKAVWNTPVPTFVQSQLSDPARQEIYQNAMSGNVPTTTAPVDPASKVPQAAIDFLRANKDKEMILRAFEEKYGVSPNTFLGGGN